MKSHHILITMSLALSSILLCSCGKIGERKAGKQTSTPFQWKYVSQNIYHPKLLKSSPCTSNEETPPTPLQSTVLAFGGWHSFTFLQNPKLFPYFSHPHIHEVSFGGQGNVDKIETIPADSRVGLCLDDLTEQNIGPLYSTQGAAL